MDELRGALRAWTGTKSVVVVVHGPPQSGKSTAARLALREEGVRAIHLPPDAGLGGLASVMSEASDAGLSVLGMLVTERARARLPHRRVVLVDDALPPKHKLLRPLLERSPGVMLLFCAAAASRFAFRSVPLSYPSVEEAARLLEGAYGCSREDSEWAAREARGCVGRALPLVRIPGAPCERAEELSAVQWVRSAARSAAAERGTRPDGMLLLLILAEACDHFDKRARVAVLQAAVAAAQVGSELAVSCLADAALACVLKANRGGLEANARFPTCYSLASLRSRALLPPPT